MRCKSTFVQTHLSSAFGILGHSVGRNPFIYFFAPLVLTALPSVGFYWINLVKDIEYLYSPVNGRALNERDAVESLFPLYSENMDITSLTRLKGLATVLLLPKDNLTVLRENILEDAQKIDKLIYNISISWKNRTLNLRDLCVKTSSGDCQRNDVLNLRGSIRNIRKNGFQIRYPINLEKINQHVSLYANGLGGITLDSNNYVTDALALRLCYLLDYGTTAKSKMSAKWEERFMDVMSRVKLQNLRIFITSSLTMDNEVNRVTEMAIPLLKIAIPLMVTFSVISTMTANCITSKPWVAVASCISPMLGVISAFGIMMMFQVQYLDINIVLLFLLSGIGLDDAFVMLAGWRRTDPNLSVEERMSQTYSETAVSITITSLTNCLSLCIGLASVYEIVRIYCKYAALSIFLAYIYQITFFGGALALSGIREQNGLHAILCLNANDNKIRDYSPLRLLCIGHVKQKGNNTKGKQCQTSFSPKSLLTIMVTTTVKISVMLCFVLYITSSFYSLKFIKEDFSFKEVMPYQSYIVDYLNVHYKYFVQYGHPIQLVINETLDYSSKNVQDEISNILDKFSEGPNMAGRKMCYSWIDYYLQSVADKRLWLSYYGYNVSEKNDFVSALRDVFLKLHNGRRFQQHIKFNKNKTEIVTSRFILFSKDVDDSKKETQLLSTLWSKADSSSFKVYVHNFWFPVYNAMTKVKSAFTRTLFTAIALVTVIFFIIICNFLCVICILLTTLSIQCGVIGYMSLWNVSLSPLSMMCILISVGLSVDYAAHISYAYLSCRESNPNKKMKSALLATGYPIIQGCVSTLLGVAVLFFGSSDVFVIFCKVMTLVMLISLFHGLLVIPVTFNVLDILWYKLFRRANN